MPKGKRLTENKGKILEKFTEAEVHSFKEQILSLLDTCEAKTASSAARTAGVSPTKVRDWMRYDEHFREQIKSAQKVLADKLIEELLNDQLSKMPQVVAKIFIIKGLAPEFRDSHKVIEFKDQRALEILEELRKLGVQPKVKQLAVVEVAENPLTGTIERVNYAERPTN